MPLDNPFNRNKEEEEGLKDPFSFEAERKKAVEKTIQQPEKGKELNNPFAGRKPSPIDVQGEQQSAPSVSRSPSVGEPIPSTIARKTPEEQEELIAAANFEEGQQRGVIPDIKTGLGGLSLGNVVEFLGATDLPIFGFLNKWTEEPTKQALLGVKDGVVATYLRGMGLLSDKSADLFASSIWSLPEEGIEESPSVLMNSSETKEWAKSLSSSVNKTRAELGLRSSAIRYEEELDELLNQEGLGTMRKVSREATRFLIPYLAFGKALGGGRFTQNYVAAPLADIAAFSHTEERLSNTIEDMNVPIVSDAVGKYMAANEDDSEAMGAFKQALEGIMLGKVSDTVMGGVGKLFSAAKKTKVAQKAAAKGISKVQKGMPLQSPRGWALEEIDVKAAKKARELLSGDIKLSPDENIGDVAENLYREGLEREGIWGKLEPEDQVAKLRWFRERAENSFASDGTLLKPAPGNTVTGETFDEMWQRNKKELEKYMQQQNKKTLKHRVESLEKAIVDRSGPLRRQLQKTPEGQIAERRFALTSGVSGKSARDVKMATREIYQEKIPGVPGWKSLSKVKRDQLDQLINLRRYRSIKSYDPSWGVKGNKMTQQTEEWYSQQIDIMKEKLGEIEFADLARRSDQYFESIIKPLDDLLDAGAISKEEWKKLTRFSYSPVKWVNKMDGQMADYISPEGRPVSVSRSGIEPLSEGRGQLLETDTQGFLEEAVVRGNSIAARNRANLAMYDLAKRGDSPVVRLKPPKGSAKKDWVKLSVMKDGNPRDMYIAAEYADQWTTSGSEIISDLARTSLQLTTGSPVTRFFATGPGNPEFAITNFTRDAAYGVLVSDQYTGFLPLDMGLYADDIAEVFPDAVARKGAYVDYINELGGMEFLSQQGIPDNLKVDGVGEALSYLNTTSEIVNRLAVRNRALKNLTKQAAKKQGIPVDQVVVTREMKEEATYIARTTIDFAQGGKFAKMANEGVPYLNAATQGMRGYARSWKKNPAKAAAYAAQLLGFYGTAHFINRSLNPEATADTPKYIRDNYLAIPTPLKFTDEEGDVRHLGIRIPMDQSSIGLKIAAEALVDKQMNKGLPTDIEVDAIDRSLRGLKTTFGIVPGVTLPPTLAGLMAYGANYDWWRQSPVWSGEQNIPEHLKFRPGDTPEFYQDIARGAHEEIGLDLSPSNMEAAVRSVMPSSVYSYALGAAYSEMTEDLDRGKLDPVEKGMIEEIQALPGVRRMTYLTSPHAKEADSVEEAIEEASEPRVKINRDVDNLAIRISRGTEGMEVKDGIEWIEKEVPPEFRKDAANRLVDAVKIDKTLKALNYQEKTIYLPSQRWWNRLSSAPAHAKAKELSSHLASLEGLPPKERKEAKKVFRVMMQEVPGFNPRESDEFAFYLKREMERQGMDAKDALYR